MATLVLGLGNPILTDDGVGVHAVRLLQKPEVSEDFRFLQEGVTFAEASVGGLRLLDVLRGYRRVVIVDAIQTDTGSPGDVYLLRPGDLRRDGMTPRTGGVTPPLHTGSTHDVSLLGALTLGRRMGMELPEDEEIVLVAVEVEDVLTFGETCTPAVAAALPHVVDEVIAQVQAGIEAGIDG